MFTKFNKGFLFFLSCMFKSYNIYLLVGSCNNSLFLVQESLLISSSPRPLHANRLGHTVHYPHGNSLTQPIFDQGRTHCAVASTRARKFDFNPTSIGKHPPTPTLPPIKSTQDNATPSSPNQPSVTTLRRSQAGHCDNHGHANTATG